MTIQIATDPQAWDAFLASQSAAPFLQSWTMGEVYKALGQEPIRLEMREGNAITGICFGHVVPARRGRHLSTPYGPVLKNKDDASALFGELATIAKTHGCTFLRVSPFWKKESEEILAKNGLKKSPLHLLAEHLWYLPLTKSDDWSASAEKRTEEEILMQMRKTTRNLIRRAEKEGVVVEASGNPQEDIKHFISLHDETRKRHGFTPYTNRFFQEQVHHFAPRNECTIYLARYQGEVIAASIHMHAFGETSYHHGASTHKHRNIPASYLLQWRAVQDALRRGDRVYNFWGIAPTKERPDGSVEAEPKHPFAGVTLFKTGFGGKLLELAHCHDLPLSGRYHVTRTIEAFRKWKRGF